MVRKDLSEPIRWNEIGFGLARIVVILFKTKSAALSFRIETPVAVEVDDVVRPFGVFGVGQFFLKLLESGWP